MTTVLEEVAMEIEDRPISDVIALLPEAEDLLEDAGVDYWFGWERNLRGACEAADVDSVAIARRLLQCRPGTLVRTEWASLAALLRQSDEQWRLCLAPSITLAGAAARRLARGGRERVTRLLGELQGQLGRHMAACRALSSLAEAIERGQAGVVDKETIRALRLQHLEFARIARDLKAETVGMEEGSGPAAPVAAIRTVVREIHRHIKVAHNFILPRLIPAVNTRPVSCEPW
jgi:iron-sulfur cluster repair protein YtfE (RIC family)